MWHERKTKPFYSFLPEKEKESRDGKSPIYARVTIDGLQEVISTGQKVCGTDGDKETKTVRDPESKKIKISPEETGSFTDRLI